MTNLTRNLILLIKGDQNKVKLGPNFLKTCELISKDKYDQLLERMNLKPINYIHMGSNQSLGI